MTNTEIICIGSVLWDVIGRTERDMPYGADRPGRIERIPGGVAMNVAMALRRFSLSPRLLTHVGRDGAGDDLIRAATTRGIDTGLILRTDTLPTDLYMAIEGPEGLVAAIADAHALEAAGDAILTPLRDGRLGTASAPYRGTIVLDGNLTADLLAKIAGSPLFAAADLRVAPASPGKAGRLRPLLPHPQVTLYANLEEAGLLCGTVFTSSQDAAAGLIAAGAQRVLITDGPRAACLIGPEGVHVALPPATSVRRITGAGDTFMAAHIAAERSGDAPDTALRRALDAAAHYVGGLTEI